MLHLQPGKLKCASVIEVEKFYGIFCEQAMDFIKDKAINGGRIKWKGWA